MDKRVNGKTVHSNVKIVHHFADGVVKDSLDGVVVPYNEDTRLFYDTLYKILTDEPESVLFE